MCVYVTVCIHVVTLVVTVLWDIAAVLWDVCRTTMCCVKTTIEVHAIQTGQLFQSEPIPFPVWSQPHLLAAGYVFSLSLSICTHNYCV